MLRVIAPSGAYKTIDALVDATVPKGIRLPKVGGMGGWQEGRC